MPLGSPVGDGEFTTKVECSRLSPTLKGCDAVTLVGATGEKVGAGVGGRIDCPAVVPPSLPTVGRSTEPIWTVTGLNCIGPGVGLLNVEPTDGRLADALNVGLPSGFRFSDVGNGAIFPPADDTIPETALPGSSRSERELATGRSMNRLSASFVFAVPGAR